MSPLLFLSSFGEGCLAGVILEVEVDDEAVDGDDDVDEEDLLDDDDDDESCLPPGASRDSAPFLSVEFTKPVSSSLERLVGPRPAELSLGCEFLLLADDGSVRDEAVSEVAGLEDFVARLLLAPSVSVGL